ncbi:hypothetical protein CBR_g334 [Chara braunii]|uniref:Uncharacterized protein n=1 Tax=Chara braunii TaxID=69332 RepID=A0A388JQC2_CHABU|nr:hypothetical protein CBR_g334 [Chara braunii]|eukprot:GBG60004.1 hypothetical protein CBR_g334 [Chara braunii]
MVGVARRWGPSPLDLRYSFDAHMDVRLSSGEELDRPQSVQVKRRNELGFIKLTRLVEISTNLRLIRCQWRGSGYVMPWEDDEEEAKEVIPPPRDEGVRPADRVIEAQRGAGRGVRGTQVVQAVMVEDGRGESLHLPLVLCIGMMRVPQQHRLLPRRERLSPHRQRLLPRLQRLVNASTQATATFTEVGGTSAEVGGASAQFGVSFSDDIFGTSLGLPPTPAGERGSGGVDVEATPISQILRERMRETGDHGAGHRTTEDAKVECSPEVGWEAGDRPASAVQSIYTRALSGGN